VKLMLAVAAIGGFHDYFIINALVYTALFGLLMAVLVLIWRGRLWAGVKGAVRFTFSAGSLQAEGGSEKAPERRITVPYGVAVAIGSVVAWYLVELPAA
jgi:Flp pilus assembly protein protease CpaA